PCTCHASVKRTKSAGSGYSAWKRTNALTVCVSWFHVVSSVAVSALAVCAKIRGTVIGGFAMPAACWRSFRRHPATLTVGAMENVIVAEPNVNATVPIVNAWFGATPALTPKIAGVVTNAYGGCLRSQYQSVVGISTKCSYKPAACATSRTPSVPPLTKVL